jgi:hypothetical protein
MKELEQLVYRKVMKGRKSHELTQDQKKAALRYLMFLKEKRCGRIKGCGCADGRKQRLYKSKDETRAPRTLHFEHIQIDAHLGQCQFTFCSILRPFAMTRDILGPVHSTTPHFNSLSRKIFSFSSNIMPQVYPACRTSTGPVSPLPVISKSVPRTASLTHIYTAGSYPVRGGLSGPYPTLIPILIPRGG